MAKPFLKWAGGKRQLLTLLVNAARVRSGRYHEPFLGGGALFFALSDVAQRGGAVLNDANGELMNTYIEVRNSLPQLVRALSRVADSYLALDEAGRSKFYYEVRGSRPRSQTGRAARTIFLNKTCFNGLYRVNQRGDFNVSHGRYVNPTICDLAVLESASAALQNAELSTGDFENLLSGIQRGDFVYLDPPYVPVSPTADFTSYTHCSFDWVDQVRVRDFAVSAADRGAYVVLSNAGDSSVRQLYSEAGFNLTEVAVPRRINSKADRRGRVSELIVSSYQIESLAQQLAFDKDSTFSR